jgi:hypothetical protein
MSGFCAPHVDWEEACRRAGIDPSKDLYTWSDVAKLTGKSKSRVKDQNDYKHGILPAGRKGYGFTKHQVIEFSSTGKFPPRESKVTAASPLPPGTVYGLEEAAQHLRLDVARVKRHIEAGDLKQHGDVLHVQDLLQFIDRFHGAYVVPILASPKFADQIPDTGEGLIQVGRLVDGIETIDSLPDEYRGPAFAAPDKWYTVWQ